MRQTIGLAFAVGIGLGFYTLLNIVAGRMPAFDVFGQVYDGQRAMIAAVVTKSFAAMIAASLVLTVLILVSPLRRDFFEMWKLSPRRGWIAAAITASIQISIFLVFVLPKPLNIFEPSLFNLHVSLATGIGGGVFEELVHRGFVILVLLHTGWRPRAAVLIAAILFAVNHIGWIDLADLTVSNAIFLLSPIWGTFFLGVALGYTFVASERRLGPVIAAHGIINLVAEPWLLLAFL